MHTKNNEANTPGGLKLVGKVGSGTRELTREESALIQLIRKMSPAIQKMMFDLAAENVRRKPPRAAVMLSLVVGAAK